MPKPPELLLTTSRFRVERVEQPTAGGGVRAREVVRHPGAVVILPLLDGDGVCLIENYRISVNQTLLELPAGTLEVGEDPAVCAARELEEETGYRADRIEFVHAFYLSPGILDEKMHLYFATGLTLGPARREPGEEIVNRIVSADEALALVAAGEIRDAKTLVALLWWDKFRRESRVVETRMVD